MKDLLIGMALGGILGMTLYKNSKCTREVFDKGEQVILNEIEKFDEPDKKQAPKTKPNK